MISPDGAGRWFRHPYTSKDGKRSVRRTSPFGPPPVAGCHIGICPAAPRCGNFVYRGSVCVFDENRWRRFLSTYAAFEEAFESLVEGYDGGFREFLEHVEPQSYKPPSETKRRELLERIERLVQTVRPWTEQPLRNAWGGGMPRPRTHVKLVPEEQASGFAEEG